MSPDDAISTLQQALMRGEGALFDVVPLYIRDILTERLWEGRTNIEGRPFRSFQEFVEHRLWEGLNTSIKDLLIFCRSESDVVEMILREVPELVTFSEAGARGGRGRKALDNVKGFSGNDPAYALARLKRDRPDLAEKVVVGEMSANAAAIEAGFRRKKVSIPDDEEAAAEFLIRNWGSERAIRLADRIKLLA